MERGTFGNQTKREIPEYISSIWKTIYSTNKQNEFVKDGAIYKIKFTEYFSISEVNKNYFDDKNGIITSPEKNVFYFVENYSIEEKIAFSDLYDDNSWDWKFIDINARYIQEWTTYYGINFTNYNIFSNSYWFLKSELPKWEIIFVRDNEDRFWYINDFKKSKLIDEDIFETNDLRENLLKNIVDDKRHIETKSDTLFKQLKKLSLDMTIWAKTEDEKIKRIYAWILENISYSRLVDFEDKKIFSGIDTYKNREGVCEGYVKLMSYMLFFAGLQNSEVIRWDVIDAQDFPYIGHAWVKIGDRYYDPTFDDPLGLTNTLPYEKYKFFWLPKDLFYTNRYDEGNTPESIKTMNLEERQDIIQKNLSSLLEKYQGKNYVLLKALEFRKNY